MHATAKKRSGHAGAAPEVLLLDSERQKLASSAQLTSGVACPGSEASSSSRSL